MTTMTAHLTATQPHIPLKSAFLELRGCGSRRVRVKSFPPPHHAVRRRKMRMLDDFTKKAPPLPSLLRFSDSSSSTPSSSLSSSCPSSFPKPSHSLLLKSIRNGYARRGSSFPKEEREPVVSLVNAERSQAPLKVADDYDDDDYDDSSLPPTPRRRRAMDRKIVTFDPQVSVVEIPSRKAYSPQVCEAMWKSRKQIRRCAKKNAIEYAFEQYDWRSATEEDDFLRTEAGLVHPAHISV